MARRIRKRRIHAMIIEIENDKDRTILKILFLREDQLSSV